MSQTLPKPSITPIAQATGTPSSGLSAAELAAILEELKLNPDEWLAEAAPAVRLREARVIAVAAMSTVSGLFQQQIAGEDVSDCNLFYNVDHVRRCLDSIARLERIVELGDFGRWVLFYDRERDGYSLVAADRTQTVSLPLTVDREGVLLAMRIAEESYALGLSDSRYLLQAA